MNEKNARYARLRYTATGAVATLAAVGVFAGAHALAAKPGGHAANCPTKNAASKPVKDHTPYPDPSPVFIAAVQRLVDNGTISAAQAQAVDRQIQAGRVDLDTLSGFTQAQRDAIQQALSSTKSSLASQAHGGQK